MKRNEFTKRAVLEVIRDKAKNLGASKGTVEIRLTEYDFLDKSGYAPIIDLEAIPDAVIELEDETDGEVHLVSTKAQVDKEQDPFWEEVDGQGRRKYPPYYIVRYTKYPKKRTTNRAPSEHAEDDFYWHTEKGLCRRYGNDEVCYPVTGVRRTILKQLTDTYTPTSVLAEAAGIDTQNLSSQIGQIRKQLKKHFRGIDPSRMIESGRGYGYRIGRGYKIDN